MVEWKFVCRFVNTSASTSVRADGILLELTIVDINHRSVKININSQIVK